MIYLLISIANAIYGILLLLTLSADTPGYYIILTIGVVLSIIGLSGFVLWMRMAINTSREGASGQDTAIKNWFGIAWPFDLVLIIGIVFRLFIVQPYIVDGSSMEPDFHDKEALLVDKVTYDFREPKRGDVVIFKAPPSPQVDYIKRIVGVPGDTIIIEDGEVSISGIPINEDYIQEENSTYTNEPDKVYRMTLKPGEYFVMGDNRQHSSDSREWGVLPKVNIIGKAWVIIYPFKDAGFVHHPEININNTKVTMNLRYLSLHYLEFVGNSDKIALLQKKSAQYLAL